METKELGSIQTVLCACDFSEFAGRALDHALQLAHRHDARLLLVHVVEPIPLGPYPALLAVHDDPAIRELAQERIESLAARARSEGLITDIRVELGNPGPMIVDIADDECVDVVVMGTRGLTGLEHVLLGSVAEYVVRRSGCPVLTIHPNDAVSKEPLETVILPTDLTSETVHAIKAFSALLGRGEKPKVILVFADRTPPYLEPFRHDTLLETKQRDVVKETIEGKMAPIVGRLREWGFKVETAVLDGDPVSVVTDLAKRRKADLIVLNTHGRSAVLNALLGRIAQRIVHRAPCPVLTTRL
jgi:nucleotide-binding universal stress UspA family protein